MTEAAVPCDCRIGFHEWEIQEYEGEYPVYRFPLRAQRLSIMYRLGSKSIQSRQCPYLVSNPILASTAIIESTSQVRRDSSKRI
jgi:hypothetical protein